MLQKREVALDNLNGILERIQAAETDGMVGGNESPCSITEISCSIP